MSRDTLHGPNEEDRRAVRAAGTQRRARPTPHPCWAEDAALGLAAVDPRNGRVVRTLIWLACAYNRSPLRAFLEATDLPVLIVEGVLPPFRRRLGFGLLSANRAQAYRLAARAGTRRGSGWLGCLVVLPIWTGLAALSLWALHATL